MDLQLFGAVLWRHKFAVGLGIALALLLTALSMVRITDGEVTYRQQEGWQTTSKILVTRTGFPEGSLSDGADDQDRFTRLAYLYASFIDADSVRLRFEARPKVESEVVEANAIVVQDSGAALPIISVAGTAATPERSIVLTRKATNALLGYIAREQQEAKIAGRNRVQVQLIQRAAEPILVAPRSHTLPIMVFLASLSLVVGLVFVRDNIQRSRREVEGTATAEAPALGVAGPKRSRRSPEAADESSVPVGGLRRREASSRRWQVQDDDVELPKAEPF